MEENDQTILFPLKMHRYNAGVALQERKYRKAVRFGKKALEYAKIHNLTDPGYIAPTNRILGLAYSSMNKDEYAIKVMREYIQYMEDQSNDISDGYKIKFIRTKFRNHKKKSDISGIRSDLSELEQLETPMFGDKRYWSLKGSIQMALEDFDGAIASYDTILLYDDENKSAIFEKKRAEEFAHGHSKIKKGIVRGILGSATLSALLISSYFALDLSINKTNNIMMYLDVLGGGIGGLWGTKILSQYEKDFEISDNFIKKRSSQNAIHSSSQKSKSRVSLPYHHGISQIPQTPHIPYWDQKNLGNTITWTPSKQAQPAPRKRTFFQTLLKT